MIENHKTSLNKNKNHTQLQQLVFLRERFIFELAHTKKKKKNTDRKKIEEAIFVFWFIKVNYYSFTLSTKRDNKVFF